MLKYKLVSRKERIQRLFYDCNLFFFILFVADIIYFNECSFQIILLSPLVCIQYLPHCLVNRWACGIQKERDLTHPQKEKKHNIACAITAWGLLRINKQRRQEKYGWNLLRTENEMEKHVQMSNNENNSLHCITSQRQLLERWLLLFAMWESC